MSFPYDFGMVPSTKGADGDPLDILILLDASVFPGCVVEARLVGVIEADQREQDGSWERNDRLVGVAVKARTHAHIKARTSRSGGGAMLRPRSRLFGRATMRYGRLKGEHANAHLKGCRSRWRCRVLVGRASPVETGSSSSPLSSGRLVPATSRRKEIYGKVAFPPPADARKQLDCIPTSPVLCFYSMK